MVMAKNIFFPLLDTWVNYWILNDWIIGLSNFELIQNDAKFKKFSEHRNIPKSFIKYILNLKLQLAD